ncbi:hypothetical protein BH11PSE2_BH11PSE2_06890 [soil metagenome]
MRKSILVVLAAMSLVLAACETVAPPPPPPPPPPEPRASADVFRSQDFSWSAIPGSNRIDGALVYRQGGVGFSCANVILMPETPWTQRRMNILYRSVISAAAPAAEVRSRTPAAPPELNAFVRQTTCDAQGQFSFTGLPDGGWFVVTVVRPVSGAGEQVALMRRVLTRGGRPTLIEL